RHCLTGHFERSEAISLHLYGAGDGDCFFALRAPRNDGSVRIGEQRMTDEVTIEKAQELISRGPYHQWLGIKVVALHDDGIELTAKWREEWVVNVERRYTHGGILAALVDLAADWAMVKKTGRGVPTIDMRVDYHSPAMPGDLTLRGKVVRMGGQVSTA